MLASTSKVAAVIARWKRSLPVAEIVERAFTASFVGTEHHLDLTDEFLEAQVNGSKQRRYVGARRVDLLPPPRDGAYDNIDRRLGGERAIEGGASVSEGLPYALRPVDGSPQASAQEGCHLGGAIAWCGHVDHLNSSAVERFELDAIGLGERSEGANSKVFLLDRAVEWAIVRPGCFEAQPAFQAPRVVSGHLLEKLRNRPSVGAISVQLGERQNGFQDERALKRWRHLRGWHVKVLAAKAALFSSDPEQTLERLQHGRLACAIDADEGGEATGQIDRCSSGSEAPEIG
jgi:hypothetical protein